MVERPVHGAGESLVSLVPRPIFANIERQAKNTYFSPSVNEANLPRAFFFFWGGGGVSKYSTCTKIKEVRGSVNEFVIIMCTAN